MKTIRHNPVSFSLFLLIFLTIWPLSAKGADVTKVSVNTAEELQTALDNAVVTEITLNNDIALPSNLIFTVTNSRTLTIIGKNHSITAPDSTANSSGLSLNGEKGTIRLNDLTLHGGNVTGTNLISSGLMVTGGITVESINLNVIGGTSTGSGCSSYGVYIFPNSTATISLSSASGQTATNISSGVYHAGSREVTVVTATGGTALTSYGAYNYSSGTLTVNDAFGGNTNIENSNSYGACNQSGGTLIVTTATGGSAINSSAGVRNNGSGSVTAKDMVTGGAANNSYGALNVGSGSLSIEKAATGGAATAISTGVDLRDGTATIYSAYGGTVSNAYGYSYGVYSISNKTTTITNEAVGGATTGNLSRSIGVYYNGSGTIDVESASGGDNSTSRTGKSYGTYNNDMGTINVNTATGGSAAIEFGLSYGVYNAGEDSVTHVTTATGGDNCNTSYGIECAGGTVTALNAIGGSGCSNSVGLLVRDYTSVVVENAAGSTASYRSCGVSNNSSNQNLNPIQVKNATGGNVTGTCISTGAMIDSTSTGNLLITGTALGGSTQDGNSIGAANYGTGTLTVDTARGGVPSGTGASYGIYNNNTGHVEALAAYGGNTTSNDSYGVYNISTGTINAASAASGEAYGNSYGIFNNRGTINAKTVTSGSSANGSSCAIYCINGTVNAQSATPAAPTSAPDASAYAAYTDSQSTVINLETANGTLNTAAGGKVNTGSNATRLLLNRDSNTETCILDYIVIASAGSTKIGKLPRLFSNASLASWYTDSAKTILFAESSATKDTKLYSPNFVVIDDGDDPTDPADPTDPTNPTDPANPTNPTNPTETPQVLQNGSKFSDSTTSLKLKVTSSETGKAAVSISGTGSKSKTLVIPGYITYQGVKYKVTSIAANAFKKNTSITSVKIPSTITLIGKNAFYGCTKLKKLTIPNSVQKIDSGAFSGCSSLTSVTIGTGLKSMKSKAFYNDKKLKTITIKSKKLTYVGKYAIKGIYKKALIKVPASKLKTYRTKTFKTSGLLKTMSFKKIS